jgi:hypothetical protein
MTRKIICEVLLIYAGASIGTALAQTACPQGVGPGSAQCGPSGGGMSPSTSAPSQPYARWQLTWGAFAMDANGNVVGTSTGQRSKRAAHRAAVARCIQMGGTDCKPKFEYKHQCAVAAEPIEQADGVTIVFQRGPTIEAASASALSICPGQNGGRTCEIKFSNCTEPYLVYN